MSRWLPIVAAGCLLGLVAVGAVLLLGPRSEPTTAQRADALAAELRCPDCQGLSVADSPTSSAREIRRQIDQLLAEGATDDEVRAHFVARYGEWIRLAPSSPVPWALPFVTVLLGIGALAWWLRSRPPTDTEAAPAMDPEQRRRLREEVDSLDA